MTKHVFLLYVNMVETYMIIIMSFVTIVVVHIYMVSVVCTFISSYLLSLLPTIFP